MQSLLWKFTVLAGVIVSSCAVVYQAHKSLSHGKAETAESFDPLVQPANSLTDAPLAEPSPGVAAAITNPQPAPTHSLASASFNVDQKAKEIASAIALTRAEPTPAEPEPTPVPANLANAALEPLPSAPETESAAPEPTLAGPAPFSDNGETKPAPATAPPGLPVWASQGGSLTSSESVAPKRSPLPLSLDPLNLDTAKPEIEENQQFPSPESSEASPEAAEPATSLLEELWPTPAAASGQSEPAPAQQEVTESSALLENAQPANSESVLPEGQGEDDPFFSPPPQEEQAVPPQPERSFPEEPVLPARSAASMIDLPRDEVVPAGRVQLPPSMPAADLNSGARERAPQQDPEGEYVIRRRGSESGVLPAAGETSGIPGFRSAPSVGLTAPREMAQVNAAPVPGLAASAAESAPQDPFGAGAFSFGIDSTTAQPETEESVQPEPAPFQLDPIDPLPAGAADVAPSGMGDSQMPKVIPGPSSIPNEKNSTEKNRPSEVLEATPLFPMETSPQPAADSTIPKSPAPSSWPTFATDPSPVPAAVTPEVPASPPAASPAIPGEALNAAIVGTGTFDPNVPSVPQRPELQIEKQAPTEAELNEPIIYSIIVRNVGKNTAHNVIVEDRIPKGTELVGTSPVAYDANGKLMWKFASLKPGEEQKLLLKVITREAGEIGSVATVSFSTSVAARIKVTAPRLSIKMHGPAEAIVGENVSFRFHIHNSGEGDAKSVWLRTILPPGLRHPGGDDIEYEIGVIPAGQSRDIDLNLTAAEAGAVSPQAMLTIDGKTQADSTASIRIIESRLRVARTGPVRRFVGRPAAFNTVVTNDSSQALTNVKIIETLPPGVELSSMPQGGNFDAARRTISWIIPRLDPGARYELQEQIVAKEAGEHTGKLVVMDDSGNTAQISTEMRVKGFADLDVNVQQYPRQPVAAGEQVSLRLVVSNDGSASASNVQAAFQVPAELGFVSARGPAPHKQIGQTVTFDLGAMGKGEKHELDIVLLASPSAPEGKVKVKTHLMSSESETDLIAEEEIHLFRETQ